MKKNFNKTIKNFWSILNLDEMQVLPGQLAFYIIMSIVPILAICTALISNFITNFNLTSFISSNLPKSLADIIIPFVMSNSNSSVYIIILGYLFMAANGPKSIIIASNQLYKIKEKNKLKLTLKSIIMTFVLIILFVFIIIIPIFGNIIIKILNNYFNIDSLLGIISAFKIIFSFLFIYISIKILYTLGPSESIKSNTTTLGAVFTSISWIIATEIFSFYITNFAKYDLLYGNFANIIILLLWVYLLSYLFVIGMALNANRYKFIKQEEV